MHKLCSGLVLWQIRPTSAIVFSDIKCIILYAFLMCNYRVCSCCQARDSGGKLVSTHRASLFMYIIKCVTLRYTLYVHVVYTI